MFIDINRIAREGLALEGPVTLGDVEGLGGEEVLHLEGGLREPLLDAVGHKRLQGLPARPDTAAVAAVVPPQPADTAKLYGDNVQIDFSNYVFAEAPGDVPRDSALTGLPQVTGNLDDSDHYRVNKYKLNFTPDIIYGNAGYDTFYGVSGSTVMAE